jgi:hypothetical protein
VRCIDVSISTLSHVRQLEVVSEDSEQIALLNDIFEGSTSIISLYNKRKVLSFLRTQIVCFRGRTVVF